MYGWRARLGYVFGPEITEIPLYEFYRMAPEGVTMVVSLLGIKSFANEELDGGYARYEEKARALALRKVDLLVVSGTPIILRQGYGTERELARRIEEKTGIRTITTVWAGIEALRSVNAKKILVLSPHGRERIDDQRNFLKQAGFAPQHFGEIERELVDMSDLSVFDAYRQAKQGFLTLGADFDAVYSPSVSFPFPQVALLEQELGIPVVTGNTAALWMALRELKVTMDSDESGEHGRLLQSLMKKE